MRNKIESILTAREDRRQMQKKFLADGCDPLLCFTMNIPGDDKNTPLSRLTFRQGVSVLEERICGLRVLDVRYTAAGPEGYFTANTDAHSLKTIAMEIEETHPVGRLFDLDILTGSGEKLNRSKRRSCIVCGGDIDVCVRSSAHTVEDAASVAETMMKNYAADYLADTAVQVLLDEVQLTPKPGLVDADNSGAHQDMSLPLFRESAQCLWSYFRTAVLLGMENEECMEPLQSAGVQAEKTMFSVTGGINTHKGAIYAFGLILSAIGSCITFGSEIFSTASLLASMGKDSGNETHGGQVRRQYRKCGARYEATEGFPNAISAYNVLQETGSPHRALLWLIASLPDTNLLYRGGLDGLVFAQELAKKTQALPDEMLPAGIRDMDLRLTERNLSPGGSADLLALAMFLLRTENIWCDPE